MSKLFVDTLHLVALVNPKDQWHKRSIEIEKQTRDRDLITTEEVLTEFLNFYSEYGPFMRSRVAAFVRDVLVNTRIKVVARQDSTFLEAVELYESRLDKGYSLTDCISLNVCREYELEEILTHDHHFAQEGFKILL